MTTITPEAGDIVWVIFDPVQETEQAGRSPAIVLTSSTFHLRDRKAVNLPDYEQYDAVAHESAAS